MESSWVFLCDDDIRFNEGILERGLNEIKRLGVEVLNFNCKEINQKTIYTITKQWGSFGSGTSFASSKSIKNIRFDTAFEYGYAEDMDFGMQLRNMGVDILYHPKLQITHLKAPMGGFRTTIEKPWDKAAIEPKPSPTVMLYAHKHYTRPQLLGYKNTVSYTHLTLPTKRIV